jgi:hypothetical protein
MPFVFRRPVLSSLLITAAIAAAFLTYMLTTARNVDEKPFILYFTLLAFPFAWLALWVAFAGSAAWWQTLFNDKRD